MLWLQLNAAVQIPSHKKFASTASRMNDQMFLTGPNSSLTAQHGYEGTRRHVFLFFHFFPETDRRKKVPEKAKEFPENVPKELNNFFIYFYWLIQPDDPTHTKICSTLTPRSHIPPNCEKRAFVDLFSRDLFTSGLFSRAPFLRRLFVRGYFFSGNFFLSTFSPGFVHEGLYPEIFMSDHDSTRRQSSYNVLWLLWNAIRKK